MTTARLATDSQKATYYKMCMLKNVEPKDTSVMNMNEMRTEIDELIKLPFPASAEQKKLLKDLMNEMLEAKVPGVKKVPDELIESLSSERIREQIDKAKKLQAHYYDKVAPTEAQLDELIKYYLYPGITWEHYEVQTKIFFNTYSAFVMDETEEESVDFCGFRIPKSRKISGSFVGESSFRLKTPDEFRKECKSKLTHAQASRIIQRHREEYNQWLRSRASEDQKKLIRRLEENLANIYVPKQVEQYDLDMPFSLIDENGAFIDESIQPEEVDEMELLPFYLDDELDVRSKKFDKWNPPAYEPIADEILDMMGRDEARKYIDCLMNELSDRRLKARTNAQEFMRYDEFESAEERESLRSDVNEDKIYENHFEKFNEFLYGICRIIGREFECNQHNAESLRHHVAKLFMEKIETEHVVEVKQQIMEFMLEAVFSKSIDFRGLMLLAEDNQIASEFVDEIIDNPYTARELLKLQRYQL